jgi:tetratricopeptide (TPR) repeat protein
MQLRGVILRTILYSVIVALIAFGLHVYLTNRAADKRIKNAQFAEQSASESDSQETPADPLPPVEPPKADVSDIIKPSNTNFELAKKAQESLLKKDFKSAAEQCEQLAEKDPKSFLCVGMSHFMLADYENAVRFLGKALEGRADEFTCRKYLAFARYYTHDLEKSISNAEKALALRKDPQLEAFLARLLREKQAHRNFVQESSSHFRIEYDGYEHGSISRAVIGMLEEAYSTIGKDLDYYPVNQITVILYTKYDFHDVTHAPGWIGGFFDKRDGKIRVPVRGVKGKEAMLRIVLFHEYVHAVIYSITKNCPLWANEGLAEYYAKGPSRKSGQVIPLERLENSFAGFDGRGIAIAYMESHSAVSYLMDRHGAHRMKDMLFSLSRGNDMDRAFTDSFHLSYTEFKDKWGKI